MKTSASYRLLRTINGCTSVARIELSATEVEGRTDIHPLWFAAATRGIDAASRAVGTRQRWWISSFLGSMVDTDDGAAWAAGAMAVFDALELDVTLLFERGWTIVLPSGQRLRFDDP